MTPVQIKNATAKAIATATTSGALPRGTAVSLSVSHRQLCITITAAPVHMLKPECVHLPTTPGGLTGFELLITARTNEEKGYSKEGCDLIAKIEAIAAEIVARRLRVLVITDSRCFSRQGDDMIAAMAASSSTPPSSPSALRSTTVSAEPIAASPSTTSDIALSSDRPQFGP